MSLSWWQETPTYTITKHKHNWSVSFKCLGTVMTRKDVNKILEWIFLFDHNQRAGWGRPCPIPPPMIYWRKAKKRGKYNTD